MGNLGGTFNVAADTGGGSRVSFDPPSWEDKLKSFLNSIYSMVDTLLFLHTSTKL